MLIKCSDASQIFPGLVLTDPDDLYQYVKRHEGAGKFYCDICNIVSHVKRSNVRNHVETKHFPTAFLYSCDFCEATFSSKTAMQTHKRGKHTSLMKS